MNRYREKFKNMILGPKMSHLQHSGHNESFPEKSERVILNHFLIPVIKYNFRKI